MPAAAAWSGSYGAPRAEQNRARCPRRQSLLLLITCLPPPPPPPPPPPNLTLPSLWLFLSLFPPALICKRRLIRARGPWWNFAVIVPNFSNIFYCRHHSFTGGRRAGGTVSIMQMMLHTFCRLLHSVAIVCANLIIKYYYAHVSFNFPKLCFNLISPPAAHPAARSQNQSSLAPPRPNKLPSV